MAAETFREALELHEMGTYPTEPRGPEETEWDVVVVSGYDNVWDVMGNDHFGPYQGVPVAALTPEGQALANTLNTPGLIKLVAGLDGGGIDGTEYDGGEHKERRGRMRDSFPDKDRYAAIVENALARTFAAEADVDQAIREGRPFDVAESSRTIIRDTLAEAAGLVDLNNRDEDDIPAVSRLYLPPGHTGTIVWDFLRDADTEAEAARNLSQLSDVVAKSEAYWRRLSDAPEGSVERALFNDADNYITRALRLEAQRPAPTDDLDKFDRQMEIIAGAVSVVTAGLDTAGFLTSSLLHDLTTNGGDMWHALHQNPDLVRGIVEAKLDTDPPVSGWLRKARHDVEIGGYNFKAGDIALSLLGSANRDPRRVNRPSLAFGGPATHNVHTCVGARVGRQLTSAVLLGYTARVPRAVYTGESADYTDAAFHGKTSSLATAEPA